MGAGKSARKLENRTSRKTPKEQLEGDHAAFDPWKGPGKNHPG